MITDREIKINRKILNKIDETMKRVNGLINKVKNLMYNMINHQYQMILVLQQKKWATIIKYWFAGRSTVKAALYILNIERRTRCTGACIA